ncbi:hypothetical protein EHQ13_14195 [Leptospira gomenensis]|uniref:hypothetical protein n=1 Tax=Leptospira gomenensis TaxID=2484974 RepID=UPI0010833388|nr:hypothetical protein [Leptospira gomenensis]TGK58406.1 hypothetical protein EHQ13_14195 [Leptospira gomenensis]
MFQTAAQPQPRDLAREEQYGVVTGERGATQNKKSAKYARRDCGLIFFRRGFGFVIVLTAFSFLFLRFVFSFVPFWSRVLF